MRWIFEFLTGYLCGQDLLQYKDRDQWYLPKFVADDAPDWNPGRFLRSRQLAPGVREVCSDSSLCFVE